MKCRIIAVLGTRPEAIILDALMTVKYPADNMLVIPVNDRSTDRTREIIDKFVEDFPGRIPPFHRVGGKSGKAAALKGAMELVNTEVILIFDADYIPGLIKQLGAPFFDLEVGGVMARVVPMNVNANLLTRLLESGTVGRLSGGAAGVHEPPPRAPRWRHGGGSEV
jgi:cellulose synthase/poly-beta-1,6-N-acetylglucosamine synthase-like glycosyltransferase